MPPRHIRGHVRSWNWILSFFGTSHGHIWLVRMPHCADMLENPDF